MKINDKLIELLRKDWVDSHNAFKILHELQCNPEFFSDDVCEFLLNIPHWESGKWDSSNCEFESMFTSIIESASPDTGVHLGEERVTTCKNIVMRGFDEDFTERALDLAYQGSVSFNDVLIVERKGGGIKMLEKVSYKNCNESLLIEDALLSFYTVDEYEKLTPEELESAYEKVLEFKNSLVGGGKIK